MNNSKIENNSSYRALKKDIEGVHTIRKITKFLSFFGIKNNELNEALNSVSEMKKQFDLISKSPDKFNEHFSKRGWIAHESMNSTLMLTSIELADKGLIEIAEQELIDHYTSENIKWLIHHLKGIEAFSIRYNFFLLAYEDTLAEKYIIL